MSRRYQDEYEESSSSSSSSSSRGKHHRAIPPPQRQSSATVRGEAVVYAQPTRATVVLSIVSRDKKSSRAAMDANAEKGYAVMQALEEVGGDFQIPHNNATLKPIYAAVERGDRVLDYWEARNTVVIETEQLDRVGALIDAATSHGEEVELQMIDFSLSELEKSRLKIYALAKAANNARIKVTAMAFQLDAQPVRVLTMTENIDYSGGPRAYAMAMPMVAERDNGGTPTTPISQDRVEVRATVLVDVQLAQIKRRRHRHRRN